MKGRNSPTFHLLPFARSALLLSIALVPSAGLINQKSRPPNVAASFLPDSLPLAVFFFLANLPCTLLICSPPLPLLPFNVKPRGKSRTFHFLEEAHVKRHRLLAGLQEDEQGAAANSQNANTNGDQTRAGTPVCSHIGKCIGAHAPACVLW